MEECIQILNDKEGIGIEEASKIIHCFFILKSIEPHLDTKLIKIKEYDYDFSHVMENNFEYRKNLFNNVRFSELLKNPENEIPFILKCVWEDVLSKNPLTKHTFLPGKCIDFKDAATYKLIMEKIQFI